VRQECLARADERHEERCRAFLLELGAQQANGAAGVACQEVALRAHEGARIAAVARRFALAEREIVQELELKPEMVGQLARFAADLPAFFVPRIPRKWRALGSLLTFSSRTLPASGCSGWNAA
jgi:hypothetical protein